MARHWAMCWDEAGKLECCCGLEGHDNDRVAGLSALAPADYGDPLLDREPMGGDPSWREREL